MDLDPVGNNTWYYVHTLAVFYIQEVMSRAPTWTSAPRPGTPEVPVTTWCRFPWLPEGLVCEYVTAGPIRPGEEIIEGVTPIGIQLIK